MPTIVTRGLASGKAFGLTGQTGAPPVYVEDVFSTYLYTGNGTAQTITNNIDLSTKGGMVWIKARTVSYNNVLFNTNSGALNALISNQTAAQANRPSSLTSFNTNGFSLGDDAVLNVDTVPFVSWTFRKQPKFFDVVQFTTDANGGGTFSHSLGAVPGMAIVKSIDAVGAWNVYHKSLPTNYWIQLQSANAAFNGGGPFATFTSTTGTIPNYNLSPNANYIVYMFADQAGGFGLTGSDSVVACGGFTQSAGTTNIYLGWEPQYILIKQVDSASDWFIFDIMRELSFTGIRYLRANGNNAESASGSSLPLSATGFATTDQFFNPGGQFIYLAIRRGPMKVPTDATKVYQPIYSTTNLGNQVNGTVGPMDITIQGQPTGVYPTYWMTTFDRLRWNYYSTTSTTDAENTGSVAFDTNVGVRNGAWFTDGGVCYNFARAPGYCDVVGYTGTGQVSFGLEVNHGLTVPPEMIIAKSTISAGNWFVWHKDGTQNYLYTATLNNDLAYRNYASAVWGDSLLPLNMSASTFTVGGTSNLNSAQRYVAYLFATCAGVSKVGSYTGTGAAQNINCGFSASARFIMIKRTDSTGDWYVYDSARGISSGNDPYLLINSGVAQVTNTNYVDPYSSGFTLTSTAPAGLNASGGTYIYLAIA